MTINSDSLESAIKTILISNMIVDENSISNANQYRDDIKKNINPIQHGDTAQIASILYGQTLALDDFFNRMMIKAAAAKELPYVQIVVSLALKAQNQCRTTLATLAEIKSPRRATFIKQQNNAVTQLVNNGQQVEQSQKYLNSKNELLTETPHETLDNGGARKAITINSPLATVGAINGGKVEKR